MKNLVIFRENIIQESILPLKKEVKILIICEKLRF